MTPLSVVIITRDEERNIERCLRSAAWADEIVVVDSGSTDRTLEICRRFGCVVKETPWLGFSRTRNLAVQTASHDWVLSIDADEEVSAELKDEIIDLLASGARFHGYRIPERSFFLGRLIRHSGWDKETHVRLFYRRHGGFNDLAVHEGVRVEGEKGNLRGVLWHYPYPDLQTFVRKMNTYTELGAEALSREGRKTSLFKAAFHGNARFFKMFIAQRGVLDGRKGFVLAVLYSFSVFLKYAKLWEKTRRADKGRTDS